MKCPVHLLAFDWYLPHQAWLAAQGYEHHDYPEETMADRADLRGAYLWGADLRGADLQGADLQGAYLWEADLQGADLRGADLQGADLRGADLQGADLQGAYLWEAQGIVSFGPCPGAGRIGYAVLHDDCVMVKLGCWDDTLENTLAVLREKRTPGYVAIVEAAAMVLEEQR